MCRSRWVFVAGLSALTLILACSASSDSVVGIGADGKGGSSDSNDIGGHAAQGGSSGDDSGTQVIRPDQESQDDPYCATDLDEDRDGDGWTVAQGDCNDCNPSINPGAFDGPDGDVDEHLDRNCDGAIDSDVLECDWGLDIADNDALKAAFAIDLCRATTLEAEGHGKTWGVISASYVKADGSPGMAAISHGLLRDFGVNKPRKGGGMLALSSGTARAPGQPEHRSPSGYDTLTISDPPPGFPKDSPSCSVEFEDETCYNPAALEIEVRVPTNALSFSFDFNFFTFEFPQWICTQYNDFFVALLWPAPPDVVDNNISFDSVGNLISVNAGFLQVCDPQTAGGKAFSCVLGSESLQGTGFGKAAGLGGIGSSNHAATGWLRTTTNVEAGSIIKLRFAIWDSGDAIWDSTVLIDNFAWHTETVASTGTEPEIQ